jgi:hypothetical protein
MQFETYWILQGESGTLPANSIKGSIPLVVLTGTPQSLGWPHKALKELADIGVNCLRLFVF